MRAAVYHRFGGPEVVHIQDVPMPAVGHDDVLIQVYASTVSAADHRACALDVPAGVWLPRRTGHPVATTPGPYRAEDLAYPVELADTG